MNLIKKHVVLLDSKTIEELWNEYKINETAVEDIIDAEDMGCALYDNGLIGMAFCVDGSFRTYNKTEEVGGNVYFVTQSDPAFQKLSKEYVASNFGLLRGWINIDEDVNREEDPFQEIEQTVYELSFKSVDIKNSVFEIETSLYDNSRAVAEVFAENVKKFTSGTEFTDTFSAGEIELENVEAYEAARFGISMFGSVEFTRVWNEGKYASVAVVEVPVENESGVDFYVDA